MAFELPALPYAQDALAPHISAETLEYHYGKHHQTYVTNLNNLTAGTEHENASLEDVIMNSEAGLFNNSAQVWNHTFYWNSMAPNGGGAPTGEVADAIGSAFGGYDAFRVLRERRTYRTHTYVWDQASYNPVTGHITCHIHFDFRDGSRLPQAFTYDWRLWTLPELREVLEEAGFARSVVYWQGWDPKTGEPDGDFQPTEVADADAGWLAYIAAVK